MWRLRAASRRCARCSWSFPDDKDAYEHADDQFMLGDALLVAPVITQNASSRSVRPSTSELLLLSVHGVCPGVGREEC